MPSQPRQPVADLREEIRLAVLAIIESGELATQRSLRKFGVRGSTDRISAIKKELIQDGSLPPSAGKSHRVKGEQRPTPVSDELLKSSVLAACNTLQCDGSPINVQRLRDAGARGSDERIQWMVRFLKESALIVHDSTPYIADNMSFHERMVRMYPGGRARLRREFSKEVRS